MRTGAIFTDPQFAWAKRLPKMQQVTTILRMSCNVNRELLLLGLTCVQKPELEAAPMPYFSFDLVIGEEFKNQGVMILEDTEIAIDKADSLAEEICVARPQLRFRGYAVRITDRDGTELYRTPVDQIPLWVGPSPLGH